MFRIPTTVILVIVFSIVLLYAHTLSYGYVYLDDTLLLDKSTEFLSDMRNIPQALTQEVFSGANRTDGIFYRPLLTVSFFLDTRLFGGSVTGYRISSLVLHILVSLLVYLFLRFFSYSLTTAMLLALFFAVHPLAVQTVAWLPGRNDLLLAVFMLPAFLFYCLFVERKQWMFLFAHLIFFLLAVFTKETALVLPFLCWAYSFIVEKRKIPRQWGILGGVWAGGAVLLILLRRLFVPNAGSYSLPDMISNVITQVPGVIVYIGKIFFPFQLSVYPDLAQTSLVPGIIGLIFIAIIVRQSKRKDWRILLFGCLWFLLFLLPTFTLKEAYSSGILREHRVYIPLLGVLLVLGQIDWIKTWTPSRRAVNWIIALMVLLYGVRAFVHTFVFADRLVFWQNAVATSLNSPVARLNLGAALVDGGDYDSAEKEYRAAIALEPRLIGIHNNLGVIYLKQQRYEEAKAAFEKELDYHPDFEMAKRNAQLVCQFKPC